MQDDILDYSKELEKFPNDDDVHRAYFMDMAIKALRLVHVSQQFSLMAGLNYSFLDGFVPLTDRLWQVGLIVVGHRPPLINIR